MDHTVVRTAPPIDSPTDTPGYRVHEALGRTSTHATWRAQRSRDGCPVVLKIPVAPQPTPLEIARLHHEVETTQALPPHAVVCALGVERWDDTRHALVLEDVGGEPMASRISPPMPLRLVLRLGCALADTLAAVHAAGVIHKDIKPANVIVVDEEQVRLADFGFAIRIARETAREIAPRELEGTLAYMAPEQTGRMNRPIDRRSDLYALGTTLYELSTGVLPFRSQDPLDLVHQHIARIPPSPREHRPELPRVLADLILKLMAKDAEARYQSAGGVLAGPAALPGHAGRRRGAGLCHRPARCQRRVPRAAEPDRPQPRGRPARRCAGAQLRRRRAAGGGRRSLGDRQERAGGRDRAAGVGRARPARPRQVRPVPA